MPARELRVPVKTLTLGTKNPDSDDIAVDFGQHGFVVVVCDFQALTVGEAGAGFGVLLAAGDNFHVLSFEAALVHVENVRVAKTDESDSGTHGRRR